MSNAFSSLIKGIAFALTVFCFSTQISSAQIGIGTTSPEGAIDVAGSNSGLLFPRVALSSTQDLTTVVNPNGGNLAAGTTVFNTNNSALGANDVQIGVYTFDGTRWNHNSPEKIMLCTSRPAAVFALQSNLGPWSMPQPVD